MSDGATLQSKEITMHERKVLNVSNDFCACVMMVVLKTLIHL